MTSLRRMLIIICDEMIAPYFPYVYQMIFYEILASRFRS